MFSGLDIVEVEETSLTGIYATESFNSSVSLELQPMEIGTWKLLLYSKSDVK